MDLDTIVKGFTLTHESIREIFGEICTVEIDDDVKFELVELSDIREGDDYPGIRVALKANYPPISMRRSPGIRCLRRNWRQGRIWLPRGFTSAALGEL